MSGGLNNPTDVYVIERHLHNYQHYFGAAASPSGETHVADHMVTTSFQADAGNDTWGAWLQILGSSDTPHLTGGDFYDMQKLFVETVERTGSLYLVQIGFGTSGAAALTNDTVTETIFIVDSAAARSTPIDLQSRRQAVGTKAWLRCWCDGQNTATMDFFIGLHEYDQG